MLFWMEDGIGIGNNGASGRPASGIAVWGRKKILLLGPGLIDRKVGPDDVNGSATDGVVVDSTVDSSFV